MHAVIAQERGAFHDLLIVHRADHDGPKAQLLALAGLFHQFAGGYASDTTEAVQHHIAGIELVLVLSDESAQFGGEESVQVLFAALDEFPGELADVDLAGGEVHSQQRLGHLGRSEDVDGLLHHILRVIVEVEHLADAHIKQDVAVEHELHALVVHQLTCGIHQVNRGFFAIDVILQPGLITGLGL